MVAAGNLSGAEKEKDIVAEAERLEIKDKAPLVLAELLFDVNMVQQLKQYKTLLQRVSFKFCLCLFCVNCVLIAFWKYI